MLGQGVKLRSKKGEDFYNNNNIGKNSHRDNANYDSSDLGARKTSLHRSKSCYGDNVKEHTGIEKTGPVTLVRSLNGKTMHLPVVLTIHCGQFGCFAIVSQNRSFLHDCCHINLRRCRVRTMPQTSTTTDKYTKVDSTTPLQMPHSMPQHLQAIPATYLSGRARRPLSLRSPNKNDLRYPLLREGNARSFSDPAQPSKNTRSFSDPPQPSLKANPTQDSHMLHLEPRDGEGASLTFLMPSHQALSEWKDALHHCSGESAPVMRRHTVAGEHLTKPTIPKRPHRNSMLTLLEED